MLRSTVNAPDGRGRDFAANIRRNPVADPARLSESKKLQEPQNGTEQKLTPAINRLQVTENGLVDNLPITSIDSPFSNQRVSHPADNTVKLFFVIIRSDT
jgi:hypothetical protein